MKYTIKTNKFKKIKEFLNKFFLSEEDKKVNFCLDTDIVKMVLSKISKGYKLNALQEKKFKNSLMSTCKSLDHLDELLKYKPDDKYVYHILFHKFKELLIKKTDIDTSIDDNGINDNKINYKNYQELNNWLCSKSYREKCGMFFTMWCESMDQYLETKKKNCTEELIGSIHDSFITFGKNREMLLYLSSEEKVKLVDYLKDDLIKKVPYYNEPDVVKIIEAVRWSQGKKTATDEKKQISGDSGNNNINNINNIKKIMNHLLLDEETLVIELLNEINKKYALIKDENEQFDSLSKNNITKLYNEHLIKNLNSYINIKKENRTKLIENFFPRDLILENIKDVATVFNAITDNIEYQKLNRLSVKKDYLTQLKKQW